MYNGWIGVDLDRTLAHYDVWRGPEHIGEPIAPMLERVKKWIAEGQEVRILTARVSHNNTARSLIESHIATAAIMEFCMKHFGQVLPITCQKDYRMTEFWDDRAVGVSANIGTPCCT